MLRSYASNERLPVYDLTVAGAHEFTAAGVIVHNCVWALHPWLRHSFGPPVPASIRKWAGSAQLEAMGETQDSMMRPRLQGARGGLLGASDEDWARLDEWAPQEDTGQPENGKRGNIRAWR